MLSRGLFRRTGAADPVGAAVAGAGLDGDGCRACSLLCPGSGSGSGCRRSAGPSAWSRSSSSPWPQPCRWSRCGGRRERMACGVSTVSAFCRTGPRPPSPTGWRPRRVISLRSRSGARIWSAPCARRARSSPAIPRQALSASRSVRAPRAGDGAGGRNLRRGGQRTLQARGRSLRLVRRRHGGELPDRRLGHAAGLYRASADDPAGPAPRRAVAGAQRRSGDGAGRLDPGGPRHRTDRSRHRGGRRRRRGKDQCERHAAGAEGHRGEALHDLRRGQRHREGRRRERHLAFHRHSGPSADHRARQGAGAAASRLAAAQLQDRGRLRRGRCAGDLRAQGRVLDRRQGAAPALRGAELPAGAAAGADPQRHRLDHQGPVRASVGGRRREHDAGRPRRRQQ